MTLSPEALKRADLQLVPAGPQTLQLRLSFAGDITLPESQRAQIVAQVTGVLKAVTKKEGESVARGDRLATIESRELGQAALSYLEARHKLKFAQAALKREAALRQQKITSEEDYLAKKHAVEEAQIAKKTAEQRFSVLGMSPGQVRRIAKHSSRQLSRHALVAPFSGTVIKRTATLGQAVEATTQLFEIADLSRVSVTFRVLAQHLTLLAKGHKVEVKTKVGLTGPATIEQISPVVNQSTRTAMVRASIENPDGKWRPGLCATVFFQSSGAPVEVAVPKAAVQELAGKPAVFVQTKPGAFKVVPVKVGPDDGTWIQILDGLKKGTIVAGKNSLVLKASWEQRAE